MASVETVAERLTAALAKDLHSRTFSGIRMDPSQVYEGQGMRAKAGHESIRVRHLNREPLPSKTGKLRRHSFELLIDSTNADKPQEDTLSRKVRRIADGIVDVYNGAQGGLQELIALNVPDVTFERVTATRTPVELGGSKHWRRIPVKLEIEVWEKE